MEKDGRRRQGRVGERGKRKGEEGKMGR